LAVSRQPSGHPRRSCHLRSPTQIHAALSPGTARHATTAVATTATAFCVAFRRGRAEKITNIMRAGVTPTELEEETNLKGFLENFNVSGLTSYNVNSAKFKPISLNAFIDINWPLITASTNYSLKGNAFNYDIYGNGGINGIIHNFSATMNVGFNLKDRHIQVRNIATKIFFEGSDFNVTGLFNDEGMSKIVSKTISDVTSKFITANQNTIAKMKLQVVFGIVLICCNARAMRINEPFGNPMIQDALEKLKNTLKTGNEKLGIPILDPFKADQLAVNINEDEIKLNANLSTCNVNGLSGYDVINGDLTMSEDIVISLHLSWPLVTANTKYDMKGKVDNFELFGNGNIKLSAQNFVLNTTVTFLWNGSLNSYLKVKNINLELSLQKLDFQATGLFNDEETSTLLSALISDMAPELISNEMVISKIVAFVTKKADDFLATKTLLEIIEMFL
ncbi:hypothetical protein G5I_04389, partial [Acromyrmex echinatior]